MKTIVTLLILGVLISGAWDRDNRAWNVCLMTAFAVSFFVIGFGIAYMNGWRP